MAMRVRELHSAVVQAPLVRLPTAAAVDRAAVLSGDRGQARASAVSLSTGYLGGPMVYEGGVGVTRVPRHAGGGVERDSPPLLSRAAPATLLHDAIRGLGPGRRAVTGREPSDLNAFGLNAFGLSAFGRSAFGRSAFGRSAFGLSPELPPDAPRSSVTMRLPWPGARPRL
jgi:hypothetical protein